MKKATLSLFLLVVYLFSALTASVDAAIDYPLPYPGPVLPDNPLYVFKVFRERATELLISDDSRKAFYYLFLSDKRLSTAQKLAEKKKMSLTATTTLVAQDYFDKALSLAVRLKNEDLITKLTVSAAKHEEVLSQMANVVSGKDSDTLTAALHQNQRARNRVRELLTQTVTP